MIPVAKRRYDLYLGNDFMRAKRITDCNSGADTTLLIRMSFVVTISLVPVFLNFV